MSVIAGAIALGLVVFCWAGNGAGAPRQAGSQVREEVTVALKLLQAYVTTKDGKPVTDLTAADFEVTDNGKVVPVTHFENHIVGGDDIAPGAPVGGPQLNRKFFFLFDFAFTDPRSSRKAREAALNFMDTAIRPGDEIGVLSYSPMRGLTIHEYLTTDHARVRNIVDAFGLRAVAGRAETLTNFLYADELRHMQDSGYPNPTGGAFQPAQGSSGGGDSAADVFFQEQARAQTGGVVDEGRRQGYTDQARQFAQTFANLARAMRYVPGWKNLILFSSGISRALIYGSRRSATVPNMDARDPEQMMAELNAYDNAQSNSGVRTEFSDALKELKNANSPIYAIDCTPVAGEMDINNPVGTSISSRELTGKDSLVQLAGESGGKYFSNSMDTKNALAAIGDITSAFYVLGYSVPAAWDGAFHKIKVKVVRPGCKVVSQNGYYNPKPFQEYSRFERLLQMTDLALSDNPLTQIPADVPMGIVPVMVGGWPNLVAYVEVPKDKAAAIIGKRSDAYLLIYDEDQGKSAVKSFRLKPPEDGPKDSLSVFAVPAKPGRYSCRIIVQNAETGFAARGSASISFADPVAAAVWLDPPLLLKAATGWADLGVSPETTLSGLFGYDPEKYAPIMGTLPAGPQRVLAAVRLSLGVPEIELDFTATDAQGTEKIEVPVTVIETHQVKSLRTCVIELTFGGLKPGPHTLTIAARDKSGAEANETTAAFTVK
ncbi:MAG: VWA domain-containing protein, partial [Candidatus Aminicenantales bacterium]